jgi:hypothetical protein
MRVPAGGAPRLGLGGILLLLLFVFLFRDELLQGLSEPGGGQIGVPTSELPGQATPGAAAGLRGEEPLVDFVSFVLDDVQETWVQAQPGYRDAKLVLFRDAVRSGCGFAQAQVGPFYCPADEKVYVDLGFFEELHRRFGAPGDFAQAYVLAHEIGHHVQKVPGIEPEVRRAQRQQPGLANELSVRLELQADCLAGVWGRAAAGRDLLEPGDVEEGLRAAAAVGDDRLQKMATGHVQPEAFTHGTSEQRMRWFRRGVESGDPGACDPFESEAP